MLFYPTNTRAIGIGPSGWNVNDGAGNLTPIEMVPGAAGPLGAAALSADGGAFVQITPNSMQHFGLLATFSIPPATPITKNSWNVRVRVKCSTSGQGGIKFTMGAALFFETLINLTPTYADVVYTFINYDPPYSSDLSALQVTLTPPNPDGVTTSWDTCEVTVMDSGGGPGLFLASNLVRIPSPHVQAR